MCVGEKADVFFFDLAFYLFLINIINNYIFFNFYNLFLLALLLAVKSNPVPSLLFLNPLLGIGQ